MSSSFDAAIVAAVHVRRKGIIILLIVGHPEIRSSCSNRANAALREPSKDTGPFLHVRSWTLLRVTSTAARFLAITKISQSKAKI